MVRREFTTTNERKHTMKNRMFLLALLGLVAVTVGANAQTASLPVDPSLIYTSLASPFTTALTWVIGAIAVLGVISWIRKAIRK
jgi:hypothetical protein